MDIYSRRMLKIALLVLVLMLPALYRIEDTFNTIVEPIRPIKIVNMDNLDSGSPQLTVLGWQVAVPVEQVRTNVEQVGTSVEWVRSSMKKVTAGLWQDKVVAKWQGNIREQLEVKAKETTAGVTDWWKYFRQGTWESVDSKKSNQE